MKQKSITTICLKCGKENDKKHKSSFGVWISNCTMCGKKGVPCADACHDFGICEEGQVDLEI